MMDESVELKDGFETGWMIIIDDSNDIVAINNQRSYYLQGMEI